MDTNIIDANIMDANIMNANIMDANIMDTNIVDANIVYANIVYANIMDSLIYGFINLWIFNSFLPQNFSMFRHHLPNLFRKSEPLHLVQIQQKDK